MVQAALQATLATHPPASVSSNAVSVASSTSSVGISSVGIEGVHTPQSNLSSNAAALIDTGVAAVGFSSSQTGATSQGSQGRPAYVVPSFVSAFAAPISSLVLPSSIAAPGPVSPRSGTVNANPLVVASLPVAVH